jgi:apolipoprotein N-acyltransferase
MEAELADRLVTPWWYYSGLGLVEALIVSSLAFPTSLSAPALVIGLAGLVLLVRNYQRLTGLGMSNQYFALARGWSVALVGVILVAIVINLLVDQPVVIAATALVVFVATVVLGQRADTAMRFRLRHGTQTAVRS